MRPSPILNGFSSLQVGRTPVEIGHAQADIRGIVTGALEVIGDCPHGISLGSLLPGDVDPFGGIDATQDDICSAVKECIGDLRRIKGHARDVEPEADPANRELQVSRGHATIALVAVFRAQVSRRGQAAGFKVDQRAQVAELTGLRGQSCGATGDGLHVLHAAHDVTLVGGRFSGEHVVTRDVDHGHIRILLGHAQGVFLEFIRSGEDQFGAIRNHIVDHAFQGGFRLVS